MNKVNLFGLDKKDGMKIWSIWTEENIIFVEHGKVNGKLQTKIEKVQGKNIGRSNETSPEQQAEFEAKSKINNRIDKGYRYSATELEDLPIMPMLAMDYLKQGHRIKYPCYESAKLDGVRTLAICDSEGKVVLKSRGGKFYDVKHIIHALELSMNPGEIWDGELYIHGKFLEEIVSAVKKHKESSKELKFVVFDIVNDEPFKSRLKEMQSIANTLDGTRISHDDIEFLDYFIIDNEDDMKRVHKDHVAKGYEGVMLRNYEGEYESGKRSADLQKYKQFLDEEFEIIGVKEDKNGNAVFEVFDTMAHLPFTVTYGDFEQRKQQLLTPEQFIGKMLTVKYQTRYKDSKLCQFPTGVCIRDYD